MFDLMQYALIFYDFQLILAQMPFPPSPLAFPSLTKPPVFDLEDSTSTRQVACSSPCPIRSLRLPSLWTEGRTG
jgi:hypothetical protein